MRLLTTQTRDTIFLDGLLSEAKDDNTIIIHIHGMQGDFYTNMQSYFEGYAQKGFNFLAGETRGSYIVKRFKTTEGGKVIGGAYEMFEECLFDIEAWINYAEAQGYKNIWLSSHSLSPAKIAHYMYKTHDIRVKGIIFMGPSDNIGLVKDPEGALDHAICFPEAQRLVQEGTGRQLLSHLLWGDKVLSANTYCNLFDDNSASNVFHYYDPQRSWEVLNSINIPVIAFTGTEDDGINPVIDPSEAMDILKQQLTHSPFVETYVFEGSHHSFVGYEDDIIDKVATFVHKS